MDDSGVERLNSNHIPHGVHAVLNRIGFLLIFVLSSAGCLLAQSEPAATSAPGSLSVGAEFSTFNSDWGCNSSAPFACWSTHLLGLGVVADANHIVGRFGVEGEARWLRWGGDGGDNLSQSNYLIGPRYRLYRLGRVTFLLKFPLGVSHMSSTSFGVGNYFTLAPGATAEYRLKKRMTVRAGYEYQIWPSFSGKPNLPNNGLTPNGFSIGASYRLLH